MADARAPRRGPANMRELGYRITHHTDADVKVVAGVLLSETALSGRCWWRAPLEQIQQLSHLSRRRTRTALDRVVAEALFQRRSNLGRPSAGAGDEYAPAPLVEPIQQVSREVVDELIRQAWQEEQEEAGGLLSVHTRIWPGKFGDSPGH